MFRKETKMCRESLRRAKRWPESSPSGRADKGRLELAMVSPPGREGDGGSGRAISELGLSAPGGLPENLFDEHRDVRQRARTQARTSPGAGHIAVPIAGRIVMHEDLIPNQIH